MNEWRRRLMQLERQASATTTTYTNIMNTCKQLIEDGEQKLTVSRISAAAAVSRKTLYTYFHDKDDIIHHIIYRDMMQPMNELRKLSVPMSVMLRALYEHVYNERAFYENLHFYMARSELTALLMTYVHAIVDEQLRDANDYTIHFYASGYVQTLLKWLDDGMPISPEQLISHISSL